MLNFREQQVCWKLHDITARLDVVCTLAFVFSHVGGCTGNAVVDQLAARACAEVGKRWCDDLWNVDTTRRILNVQHRGEDMSLVESTEERRAKFRFRSLPETMGGRPSGPLPRGMERWKEKLVYRARVGMVAAVGGSHHGHTEPCPFCGSRDVLGRDGATVVHLTDCAAAFINPPVAFSISSLWLDPIAAAQSLAVISNLAKARATW